MDLRTLERLARGGFAAVSADQLEGLAEWCDNWSIATGEAKFSVIGEALREIEEAWGEQGLPRPLVLRIEEGLGEYLQPSLEADDPKEGAYFAARLREVVRQLPWTIDEWEREGWVRRTSAD